MASANRWQMCVQTAAAVCTGSKKNLKEFNSEPYSRMLYNEEGI